MQPTSTTDFDSRKRKGGFGVQGSLATRSAPEAKKGSGGWKKWTGVGICQAAFAPPQQSSRSVAKADGASHGRARESAMFTADAVECRQEEDDDLN